MKINKRTVGNIKNTVASYYEISVATLVSPRKTRVLTRQRGMAILLVRQLTQCSFPEIGEAFERDQQTVFYACKRIKTLMAIHPHLRSDYEILKKEILCVKIGE